MLNTNRISVPKRINFWFRRMFHDGLLFSKLSARKKDIIFYACLAALPILQFVIFYIIVNINSIVLAFQNVDITTGQTTFAGFDNFKQVFIDLFTKYELIQSWKNSFIAYGIGILFGVPFSLFFSFYIYKKYFGSKFFKVLLFLPSIISSIAMIIMFSYFAEDAFPDLMKLMFNVSVNGLLSDTKVAFGTVLFYATFTGFGTSILMYSSAMSGIDKSLVEAAQLDGASPFREFFSISIPMIWPTLVTFLVVGVASIFTNQVGLFAFYGGNADFRLYTFGYYLFKGASEGTQSSYTYLAAMGIIMTIFAVPLTYLVKFVLEKYGPRRV